MKIFLTGATGFIGTHVVNALYKNHTVLLLTHPSERNDAQPESVRTVKGDLAHISKWQKELAHFRPAVTIHLAWEGIPHYDSRTSIKNLWYGLDLISMLRDIGCKKFIGAGSCWEYGEQSGKLDEEHILNPINAYGAAKISLRFLGEAIAKEGNMQFIWTRFFYVYGPGQKESSLIPHAIRCIQSGNMPEIKSPLASNDFIYVEDVACALKLLAEKGKKNGVYNIGSGKLTRVQAIINLIFKQYRRKHEYRKIEQELTDKLAGFYADTKKIEKEVGWKPLTAIREGIKKTIAYYSS